MSAIGDIKRDDVIRDSFKEGVWSLIQKSKFDKHVWWSLSAFNQKIHTIRKDQKKRWKPGIKIHFYFWNRTKKSTCFGILPCTGVQEIYIDVEDNEVYIPLEECRTIDVDQLALNDGFDSTEEFWEFFTESGFYRIIHWTDSKY